VSDHNVQMLTRGTVADVSRASMQELALTRPAVGRAILISTLVEASIFREWVLNVGRRDSRSRIAHLLCEFAVRLEAQGLTQPGGFELPMTQEQLADATGLTSVHVNRVLRILELDGLITRNRRSIQFPSWQRIRDAGDFNRRYLHLSDEQDLARV
jgi:CRP-like cAMP-binding protein